jgi:hypothetical protein
MIPANLASKYPNLVADGGIKTSNQDPAYNCIAWAAQNDTQWWWQPGGGTGIYWPPGVLDDFSFQCFVELFEKMGYVDCLEDHLLESGYEKVAIYADDDGEFTHVAKQLPSGAWTSKLGPDEDVQHNSPHGLEGRSAYGSVKRILKRRRDSSDL